MKKSLGLVLIYFVFQVLGAACSMLLGGLVLLISGESLKTINSEALAEITLAPALLLGIIFMIAYLWKSGLISREKITWSPVSAKYLLYSVGIYAAFIMVLDFLMARLSWLPNLMEDTFNVLQSGWMGIFCIAVLGPVLEELLFRGAITKVLLREYSPAQAITFSALIFGVFHLNPVQVVAASLIGLLLGWIYYKSASLVPCILLHVLNNSLSVYLALKHPDQTDETIGAWIGVSDYLLLAIGIVGFIVFFLAMRKMEVAYPWRKQDAE